MRSEEEIRQYLKGFYDQNPKEWIYKSNDKGLQGWYQGMEQAFKWVLEDTECQK